MDLWKHQPRGDQDSHLPPTLPHQHQLCPSSSCPGIQKAPKVPNYPLPLAPPCPVLAAYDEGLAVDVVEVQREDVVLAAHIHAVVVLVLQQDAVVTGVEEEVEEVCCACRLQFYGGKGKGSVPQGPPSSPGSSLREDRARLEDTP